MRAVFLPALLLSLMLIAGCGVHSRDPIVYSSAAVPKGKSTKRIALAKVVSDVTPGAEIGYIQAGAGCLNHAINRWRNKKSTDLIDKEFGEEFVKELKRRGYNVVGDPNDLFNDGRSEADIFVGVRIRRIRQDICFTMAGFGLTGHGKTSASVEVDWQVFDRLDQKTLHKMSSVGNATTDFNEGKQTEAIYKAFGNAVEGLMADQGFLNAVLDSTPTGPMGGLADNPVPTAPGTQTVASSKAALPGAPPGEFVDSENLAITNSKPPASLDAAKKSVVVIQLPGGHGSGFLIGNSNLILTNDHVVKGQKRVRIIFSDGSRTEGIVLKTNPRRDIAVVQITSAPVAGLPYHLADLPTGSDVFAIGAPAEMFMQGSLSKGIVSGYRPYRGERWLQSDAAINGGNSGGPLLDSRHRVVAVCSLSIVGRNRNAVGLNLFVPIAEALQVLGIQTK